MLTLRQSPCQSLDFVADFLHVLPWTKFHYADTNEFVANLSQTLSLHLDMVCEPKTSL